MIIITILVKQTQNKKVTLLYINKIIAKKTHCSVGKKNPIQLTLQAQIVWLVLRPNPGSSLKKDLSTPDPEALVISFAFSSLLLQL